MRKFLFLSALILAAACLCVSCKKSDDVVTIKPDPSQILIPADQFMNSSWKGTQTLSTTAQLTITSTEMNLSYYVKKSLSKNTDEMLDLVRVKIFPYTYDEDSGKFSGTGSDNTVYQGQVVSSTSLKIELPSSETVTMFRI